MLVIPWSISRADRSGQLDGMKQFPFHWFHDNFVILKPLIQPVAWSSSHEAAVCDALPENIHRDNYCGRSEQLICCATGA